MEELAKPPGRSDVSVADRNDDRPDRLVSILVLTTDLRGVIGF